MIRQEIAIAIVSLIMLLLIFIRVFYLSELGGTNAEYALLLEKVNEVERENISLRAEILHESSFSSIAENAKKHGFIDASYYLLK